MIKFFVLLPFTILILAGNHAVAAGKCARVFAEAGPKLSAEDQRYIDDSILALAHFRLDLDTKLAQGVRSIELTMLKVDYLNKEKELAQYLEMQKIMTREELVEQVKSKIPLLQEMKSKTLFNEQQDKDNEGKQRKVDHEKMRESALNSQNVVFNPVKPGKFFMGKPGNQRKVEMTKPFEMMATLTTNILFNRVVLLAQKRFADLDYAVVQREADDTTPVVGISYKHVQLWLKALNRLSEIGEPGLSELIRGHKKGSRYRLPTEKEWEFVARGGGKFNGNSPFDSNASKLEDYAWFEENSRGQIQPVATKKPLIFDGNEFFDLFGNVSEHVQHPKYSDFYDPREQYEVSDYTTRGGSFKSKSAKINSWAQSEGNAVHAGDDGFRLVREVRP